MTTPFKMPEKTHFSVDYRMGHTDDALKQALRDVLEQAAQIADDTEPEDFEFVAANIRAMKEQIK